MAAIAGFEILAHPTPQDFRQFSNLFLGLFPHVGSDTRRVASAALSRLPSLPDTMPGMVADQPIEIAAPFLANSPVLNERTLLQVIARHGPAHARAIAKRGTLTPVLVTALSGLKDAIIDRTLAGRGLSTDTDHSAEQRRGDEERLRERLRLTALDQRPATPMLGSARQRSILGQLLAQQAVPGNRARFAQCLALAIRSDSALAARITRDASGRQLATALRALQIGELHALACLEGLFPHLAQTQQGMRLSRRILRLCDPRECRQKLDAWRRAGPLTATPSHQPMTVDLPSRAEKLPGPQRMAPERRARPLRIPSRRA